MSEPQSNAALTDDGAAQPATGPAPYDPQGAQPSGRRAQRGVLGVAARHWKLLLAWGVLCGAFAWCVGDRFKQLTWQAEGMLIYTPLTLPENQRAVYAPPSPDTLTSLVKSPNTLDALRREFGLGMPVKDLDKRIKVNRSYNSDTAAVSLDWADPEAGAAMLNRLMALHAAEATTLRKKKTEEALANLKGLVADGRDQYEKACAEQAEFLAAHSGRDPQAEAARLASEMSLLEASLLAANRECDDCESRLNGQAQAPPEPGDAAADPKAAPGGAEVDAGSLLYQRKTQMQDALEQEKGALAEARTALDAKQQEHEVAAHELVNNVIPRAEFDKLTAELQLCRQHVQNSEAAVKRYEQELRDLPARSAALRKTQLEQQLADKRREAGLLKATLALKQGQAEEAAALLRREAPLAEKVKDAKAQLEQYVSQEAALRQLHDNDAAEVAVLTPAAAPAAPASSTRKTLTAAAFAAPMLLLLGVLVGLDRLKASRAPTAALEKMGMVVLAPPPGSAGRRPGDGGDGGAGTRAFRRVALRVRDRVADAGPVVLFSSLNGGPAAEGLAYQVGRLLGTSDERLLILDVRPEEAAHEGPDGRIPLADPHDESGGKDPGSRALVQFLRATGAERPAVIRRTGSASVDYIRAGAMSDPDFLASKSMSDMLAALGGKYARIIVVASPVGENMEAEALASWMNAVVLTVPGGDKQLAARAEEAVRSLREGGTPLFGVCCE